MFRFIVATAVVGAQASSCPAQSKAVGVLLQDKASEMGVPCEEMCKRLGVYPDGCQCPGFNGQAPTPGDGRSCVAQWCQDPSAPCPNDGFVECVDASSAVSALQWKKVMENVDTGFAALLETARMHKTAEFKKSAQASATTCNKKDKAMQVLLQSKAENMGVPCEEMCKRLGVYPDGCQCPGFNGQAPTPGDGRSCVSQWCQDPKSPCPNDGFVECVDASSAVSALQWKKAFMQVDKGVDSLHHMLSMMRNSTKK